MNISINLPDPKRCEGCPCIGSWLAPDDHVRLDCHLGYWTDFLSIVSAPPRPAKCIEEHGA